MLSTEVKILGLGGGGLFILLKHKLTSTYSKFHDMFRHEEKTFSQNFFPKILSVEMKKKLFWGHRV